MMNLLTVFCGESKAWWSSLRSFHIGLTFANIIHEGWGFIPGCSSLQAAYLSILRKDTEPQYTDEAAGFFCCYFGDADWWELCCWAANRKVGLRYFKVPPQVVFWRCGQLQGPRVATQLYSVNSVPDLVSAPTDFSTKMMVISDCFILNDLFCWGKLVFCLSLRCGSMGMKSHIWSLNYSYCYKDISMPHNPYKLL